MKALKVFSVVVLLLLRTTAISLWAQDKPTAVPAEIDMSDFYPLGFSTVDEVLFAKFGLDLPWTDEVTFTNESQHEYVDLGLSVKWATCNIGAEEPEDYGDYFAWGETEPYYYSLSPLVWKEGHEEGYWGGNSYFDYDSNLKPPYKKYGADGMTVLAPEDDAAHVNWGGEWRMPTREEFQELIDKKNCTWTWTSVNGIQGFKVESRKKGFKGNYIFLPGADSFYKTRWGSSHIGLYWSSTLYGSMAWSVEFVSNDIGMYVYGRPHGFTIRPVCPK